MRETNSSAEVGMMNHTSISLVRVISEQHLHLKYRLRPCWAL